MDRDRNDPSRKEDLELGIDRSKVPPIKFVSAIDSKPIYPPYLQLADFDSYVAQEADTDIAGTDKKKDSAAAGDKEDGAGATASSAPVKQKTAKGVDDVGDYKQEMEEFRYYMEDLYKEKAVKLMEDVE